MKINRENLKPLGGGGEKEVYENPNNPEQTLGIFHRRKAESPERAKGRFYLTKILHLLFPKNVPNMHLATSDPYAIVTDKVENENNPIPYEQRNASQVKDVSGKLKAAGLTELDEFRANFKLDKEGNVNYVDSFRPWFKTMNPGEPGELQAGFDKEKLEAAIQNLDEDKKELAMTYLQRLNELYEKELEDFKKSVKS